MPACPQRRVVRPASSFAALRSWGLVALLVSSIAACTRSTTIEPPAGFEVVASGRSGGLGWTLSSKPGDDGATCWHLDTEPEVEQLQSDTECLRKYDPKLPRAFATEFPFGTAATGNHDIVVAIVPGRVRKAAFGFANGDRSEPTYLDEDAGVVLWAGESRPYLAGVAITLADGTRLGCGPGDTTSASQLEGRTEAELLDIRQFVWTCLDLG
jgi:hypothetical protein